MKELPIQEWNRLLKEAMTIDFDEAQSNFKYPFKVLSKKFGRAYLEYCKTSWQANRGVLTPEEFCKINGEIPMPFFNKVVSVSPDNFKVYIYPHKTGDSK